MLAQIDKLNKNVVGAVAPAATAAAPKVASTQPEATVKESTLPEPKAEITYDDFAKIDLRVGTIIKAEKVEKADKLLRLELDMGTETRTVVSGIAMHYKPEDIIGRQVTVVANLAPRKLKGIESRGMILMAQNADGRLIFASPTEMADAGAEVK